LNRDELRHVTAMEGSIVPQPTASLNMNERQRTAQLNLNQLNTAG